MDKEMFAREQRIMRRQNAETALQLRVVYNKPLDQIIQALTTAKQHDLLSASDVNLMQVAKLIAGNMDRGN